VVDFRPLKEAMDREKAEQSGEAEWTGYEPGEALAKEADERERDREIAELRQSLDEGYREAVEQAAAGPPPATVRAYEEVFGSFPRGWPPTAS
jgi:TPP-dependent pyruvate/acetoin dehydrogenase alpha subunit